MSLMKGSNRPGGIDVCASGYEPLEQTHMCVYVYVFVCIMCVCVCVR